MIDAMPLIDAMPDIDERKLKLALSAPRALGPLAGQTHFEGGTPPFVQPPDVPTNPLGLGAPARTPINPAGTPPAPSLTDTMRSLQPPDPNDPRYAARSTNWRNPLSVAKTVVGTLGEMDTHPEIRQASQGWVQGPGPGRLAIDAQRYKDQLAQTKDLASVANTESEIAARNKPPKNEGKETMDNLLAAATSDAQKRGVDPNTDPKVQQIQAEMDKQKPPAAPKENRAVAGTVDGKPTYAVQTENGWVSVDAPHTPLKNFQPQPSFAETGLWEPTMVPGPQGQGMVPGRFNKRTGQATPVSPTTAAIPAPAQKEINTSLAAARESDTRQRVMHDNEQDALKGNQQAMLALVANHIGMTLGQQKGARINQAVWSEAIQSTPWLQGVEAKFDNRGYLSGVTLTPDQIKQMVALADERRMRQWQQAADTAKQYGVPDTVQVPQDVQAALNQDLGDAGGRPEGSTGQLPDGTRVVVKNGRIMKQ